MYVVCPRCGFDAGSAKFCVQCGSPLDDSLRQTRRMIPLLATGLGLVLIAGIVLASGALRLRDKEGQAGIRVPATGEDVGLKSRGDSQSPALAVAGKQDDPGVRQKDLRMPDDVRKWLEHLKRVDKKREDYNTAFVMKLMGQIGHLQPGTYIDEDSAANDETRRKNSAHEVVDGVDSFFASLTQDFQSLQPPVECGPIAAQYSAVLIETRGMLEQITTAITNLDTHALEAMQGTTFDRLDTKAEETNGSISSLCEKYDEPNKYAVFVDKGSALGIGAALTGGTATGIDQKALQKIADDLLNEGVGR